MLDSAINLQLKGGGHAVRQMRARSALRLVQELASNEQALHDGMPPHVQRIMSRKRLLLLQALLRRSQCPDKQIAMDMASGFPLCGWMAASSVFPKKVRPPTLHESVLTAMGPSITARTLATVRASDSPEFDEKLWDATFQEVTEGLSVLPRSRNCDLSTTFLRQW